LSGYVPSPVRDPGTSGSPSRHGRGSPRGEPRLTTTIATFATALDVTVAELRLEEFPPADAEAAAPLAG
jgi:hypothetical protein